MNGSNRTFQGLLLAFLLSSLPLSGYAQTLKLELTGLDGDLKSNALAWLGQLPETAQARSNYLHSAEEKVGNSLRALGYYRPQIDLHLERLQEPWTLRIDVVPGEPVHLREVDIEVTGAASEDPAFRKYLENTGLKTGDVLNHEKYEQVRRKLNALGLQHGYFDGEFTRSRVAVEAVGGTADVELHYASGQRYRFGALDYDRQEFVEELVEPLVTAREGEPYDQARLRESQIQLQRTGYFSTVLLQPRLDAASQGEVPLKLQLFPAKRHSFDVGIGYSTDTEERVTLAWRTPRINRWGHSQETRLQYSPINPSGRVTYSIPMSHPLNDTLQFSVRVEDNEFGDLESRQHELGGRREFKSGNWIYSYSLRALRESWNAAGESREGDYVLPGFSISQRLRKGSLVNPSAGFSQWYRLEGGSDQFGSDVDLVRVLANYGYIHSFGERHRVVLRSDLGAVVMQDSKRHDLAPSLAFFAGGSQSLRGYGYQSIGSEVVTTNDKGEEVRIVVGGERLATASIEYQYTFTDSWRGSLFLDGGDAFDAQDFEFHGGAGVGIHYLTPVGAVRFEIANPYTDDNPNWRVNLAIGAEF
ncbi:autotransporter assembly complex protein TamA [Haliea sp. E17]|uniref:autotransporter assembly complex protein TamA n=1 Tax=Haliea sp. E17 TaxID=3401576 RepID=UPI003AAED48E